jgi:hypothetical protein
MLRPAENPQGQQDRLPAASGSVPALANRSRSTACAGRAEAVRSPISPQRCTTSRRLGADVKRLLPLGDAQVGLRRRLGASARAALRGRPLWRRDIHATRRCRAVGRRAGWSRGAAPRLKRQRLCIAIARRTMSPVRAALRSAVGASRMRRARRRGGFRGSVAPCSGAVGIVRFINRVRVGGQDWNGMLASALCVLRRLWTSASLARASQA